MSRKYIRQQIFQDFVYPNNDVPQYDVDNVVHDINNNSVTGTINSLSASTITATGFTLNWNLTWNLNGAEPFIKNNNTLSLWSIHCLAPGQNYYKPWRAVVGTQTGIIGSTTFTGSGSFIVTASALGLTNILSGTYYFEIRFIGHRSVYPIITTLNLVVPTPTPTPTLSPTLTPTITPTPGTPTPTPTPTATPSTGKDLQIYLRDVASSKQTLTMFYSVNGGGNINIPGATGTQLPSSCTYTYTITGLTAGDSVVFGTSNSCVMVGTMGTSCPAAFGSQVTYTYIVDAPSIQTTSISIDSEIIP